MKNTNLNYVESTDKRRKFSTFNFQFSILLVALLALASCSKDNEEPKPADPYATFKANSVPRWENGTTITKNEDSNSIFLIDAEGALFGSAKYKTGYTNESGSNYEMIEFSGAAAVGKPASPTIRKPSGVTDLHSLEILKVESGKLWIVFKETASSAERRIVQ